MDGTGPSSGAPVVALLEGVEAGDSLGKSQSCMNSQSVSSMTDDSSVNPASPSGTGRGELVIVEVGLLFIVAVVVIPGTQKFKKEHQRSLEGGNAWRLRSSSSAAALIALCRRLL